MNTPNFSDIYTLYFEDVYKYLLALCHDEELAEELAQDTFFKAMKSYENFRGDCKITTWLCQIAKHSFFLYEKHRKRNIDLNSVENEIVDTNSIEILLGQREQAFGIHKLLHNLPEPYKEVFSLRVADGLFCREIDGLFCRSSPDIIVRRRCVLSHKRRGWLQPSPSFRYSRNLALQDELYHPVINNGPAVLVCVDKRLGTGPVNQSRDAG